MEIIILASVEPNWLTKLDKSEKMNMRGTLVLMIVAMVTGCSTELTPEAQNVRQIAIGASTSCAFLGAVSTSEAMGLDIAGDTESAFNKMRNAVASRGGNAFVLTNSTSNYDSTNVQADAYDCK